jgi:lipopolysaccharide export LptBFGC system permease protein LptF
LLARQLDVFRDLFAQRVDRFESALFAQPPFEGQIDLDTIKVGREIEHMGLGDQVAPISKRRAIADIRDDRQAPIVGPALFSEPSQVTEIDAWSRENLRFWREVRCRKPDGATSPIPLDDPSPCTEGPPEQHPGLLDLAVCQEFADSCRIHVPTLDLNLGHDRDGESQMGPALGQHAHRALSITSKMKVISDVDFEWPHTFVNMMSNEMLWADPRERMIEGFSDHGIQTQAVEGLHFLLERIEQPQFRFRLKHPPRMGLERIENRFAAKRLGAFDHELENRLMPEVNAIEVSERQHRTRKLPIQICDATKDLQALAPSARLNPVRILSHYFVARFLGLFLTVLIAALLILATVELVLNLDDFSALQTSGADSSASASLGVLRYLWIRLVAYYLTDLLPITSFVAVFITFAWAGRSLELLALRAGGIRMQRVVAPVLLATLILSLATALLHETVILPAQQTWSSVDGGGRDQPDFGRKSFWYHKGRIITNISSSDPDTRTLFGVEIFERSPTGSIIRVIRVDRVHIAEDGVWHLEDAKTWTFDPAEPSAEPILTHNPSIELDLDATRDSILLAADPGLLPLPTLFRFLEANSAEASSNLRRLRVQFHDRLSSPWLLMAFAWLALPFAFRVDHRGHFGAPAAAAIATLGLFFLLQSAGTTIARQALLPAGLTPWLSIAVVFFGAAIALARRPLQP